MSKYFNRSPAITPCSWSPRLAALGAAWRHHPTQTAVIDAPSQHGPAALAWARASHCSSSGSSRSTSRPGWSPVWTPQRCRSPQPEQCVPWSRTRAPASARRPAACTEAAAAAPSWPSDWRFPGPELGPVAGPGTVPSHWYLPD